MEKLKGVDFSADVLKNFVGLILQKVKR